MTIGTQYQTISTATNITFLKSGNQVMIEKVPPGYQFNRLFFDYINLPVMIDYLPFVKNNRAVAIRFGPSLGFLTDSRQKALINGIIQKNHLPVDKFYKVDINFEISTLTLPAKKANNTINVGVGASYQLTDFSKDINSFNSFSAFFKLGFQF